MGFRRKIRSSFYIISNMAERVHFCTFRLEYLEFLIHRKIWTTDSFQDIKILRSDLLLSLGAKKLIFLGLCYYRIYFCVKLLLLFKQIKILKFHRSIHFHFINFKSNNYSCTEINKNSFFVKNTQLYLLQNLLFIEFLLHMDYKLKYLPYQQGISALFFIKKINNLFIPVIIQKYLVLTTLP